MFALFLELGRYETNKVRYFFSLCTATQLGTAYFIESSGGPLAVNAQGYTNAHSE